MVSAGDDRSNLQRHGPPTEQAPHRVGRHRAWPQLVERCRPAYRFPGVLPGLGAVSGGVAEPVGVGALVRLDFLDRAAHDVGVPATRGRRLLGEVFGEGSVRQPVDALIVFAIKSEVWAGGVDQLVDRRLRDRRAGDGGGQRGPDTVTDGSSAALRDGQCLQQRVVGGIIGAQPLDRGGKDGAVVATQRPNPVRRVDQLRSTQQFVGGQPGVQELLVDGCAQLEPQRPQPQC